MYRIKQNPQADNGAGLEKIMAEGEGLELS